MKNKKGFTLIELLAVIVILAIIALIATPIILNMITKARKNAARSSALGYIDAIEYNNGFASIGTEGYTEIKSGDVTNINVKLKGQKPTSGTITVDKDGKVTKAENLCINGYIVNYDGQDATVGSKCNGESTPESSFKGTKKAATSSDTHKGIVYMDPSDLTATCDSNSTITTTPTGCKKFYIFDDSGNTYKMLMDRNTTAQVAYNNARSYVPYDQASIKAQVETDTAGWVGNPRLITAQEVADITNSDKFDGKSGTWFFFDGTGDKKQTRASSSQGASIYKWLFDYTKECTNSGCDIIDSDTYGYWTSSAVSNDSSITWSVDSNGNLSNYFVNINNYYGIRPVIEIEKSQLN